MLPVAQAHFVGAYCVVQLDLECTSFDAKVDTDFRRLRVSNTVRITKVLVWQLQKQCRNVFSTHHIYIYIVALMIECYLMLFVKNGKGTNK